MIGEPPRLYLRRNIPSLDPAWIAALKDASTPFVSDAMKGFNSLPPNIKGLSPADRFIGRAVTAACQPGDGFAAMAAIDYLTEGDVLVIACEGFRDRAVIGDRMAQTMRRRGCVAVVTEGTIRDKQEVQDTGLIVFCAGVVPITTFARGPGIVNEPVAIGHTVISAGDLIMGDEDGVVVIPNGRVAGIVAELDAVSERETATQNLVEGDEILSFTRRRFPDIDSETVFLD